RHCPTTSSKPKPGASTGRHPKRRSLMSGGKAPIPNSDRAKLQRAALERMLAEEGLSGSAGAIPSRGDTSVAPASYSQELLWLLDQSTPDLTAYNGPVARRLRGS